MGRRTVIVVALAGAVAGGIAADACAQQPTSTLTGTVLTADRPLARAPVRLVAGGASAATVLGTATTDEKGTFTLSYTAPAGNVPLYALASRGRRVRLAGVVGSSLSPLPAVTVNELTTVGTAFALAQFLHGPSAVGPSPGLQNAAATASNLADMAAGKVSFVLANAPNGAQTEALPTFNALANAVATCTRGTAGDCDELFRAATPSGQAAPTNTLDALVAIARNPASRVREVFRVATGNDSYAPALEKAPTAWTLVLNYTAGGFDAPGNLAIDAQGNVWANNNFLPPGSSAGTQLTVLGPTGVPILGSPLHGGGLDGAGFGIAIDPAGSIWVANYTGDTVSKFSPAGTPLSPTPAFGNVDKPQGIAVDQRGTVWIPNLHDASVTVYPQGNPAASPPPFTGPGLDDPFDIAIDASGNAWVAGNTAVTELDPNGNLIASATGGRQRSDKGIAVDSVGNLWVASFEGRGVVEVSGGRVTQSSPFRPPALTGPWGMAVDGNDNVWVADFLGDEITELCGRNTAACARTDDGSRRRTGDPISPAKTGFDSAALQHLTCVQVDASGNVWACNNWSTGSSFGRFVGGSGVIEVVGLAAPVATPLIGPPRQP